MPRLSNADAFPDLTVETVGNGTLSVPQYLAGRYGVILMYRGSWCPYCNAQLSAFARAKEKLDELGIGVVALSVDSKADAAALVDKHRLNFPVGYGVNADEIATSTGAYVNDSSALPAIYRLRDRSRRKGDHRSLFQRRDRETGRRRRARLRPLREVQGLSADWSLEGRHEQD